MSAALLDMPTARRLLFYQSRSGSAVLRSHRLASRATRHLKLWRIDAGSTHRIAAADRLRSFLSTFGATVARQIPIAR